MADFKDTNLFSRLSASENLKHCIIDLRENCILLGETIKTLIPGFTDHSVRHMDALWSIADSVFTKEEVEIFSPAEAFALGASFYFHDLGMSLASTKEGIEKLKIEDKYKSYYQRGIDFYKLSDEKANVIALQLTARQLHSENAKALCKEKVLGLNKYIIEKENIRVAWSDYIGDISASHHWPIAIIDKKL